MAKRWRGRAVKSNEKKKSALGKEMKERKRRKKKVGRKEKKKEKEKENKGAREISRIYRVRENSRKKFFV